MIFRDSGRSRWHLLPIVEISCFPFAVIFVKTDARKPTSSFSFEVKDETSFTFFYIFCVYFVQCVL